MIDATRSTHNQEIVNSYVTGYNKGKLDAKIEFIEKACEWLENNMYYHDCGNYDVLAACCSNTIKEVIEKFKKSIEE